MDAALVELAELGALRLKHCLYSLPVAVAPLGAGAAGNGTVLQLGGLAVARLRVVLHDLAFEDPDLGPDDPVGRGGFRERIVDVGPQRVQGHAALAVPFGPR